MSIAEDREDYAQVLNELGMTEADVQRLMKSAEDLVMFPAEYSDVLQLSYSPIDGVGLFAERSIYAGEEYAPARLQGNRTPGGRFVNHAKSPNSKFTIKDGDLYLTALREISKGEEITLDYRQARQANIDSLGGAR